MHKSFCTWILFDTCSLTWEYFACPNNTFNELLPQKRRGLIERWAYLQLELEKGTLIERGHNEEGDFIELFTVFHMLISHQKSTSNIKSNQLKSSLHRMCTLQQHEKRQHYFDILKAFFVRHSSKYKTSASDRKVNRNIYPDAVTRDKMRLIDPKSGQLDPIHHCCLVEEL